MFLTYMLKLNYFKKVKIKYQKYLNSFSSKTEESGFKDRNSDICERKWIQYKYL